jgi:hypothetical protein
VQPGRIGRSPIGVDDILKPGAAGDLTHTIGGVTVWTFVTDETSGSFQAAELIAVSEENYGSRSVRLVIRWGTGRASGGTS